MPIYEFGDMWSVWEETDLFLITTNASLGGRNGALAMGRGIALQARNRLRGIDQLLGSAIGTSGRRYGLLISPKWPKVKLGLFQVKFDYWDPAVPELIRLSTDLLMAWLKEHPGVRVDLNFPGIGYGKLPIAIVLPIISVLPRSVHIWQHQGDVEDNEVEPKRAF